MATVLSFYTSDSFEEFMLPPINNADYSLLISKEKFNLKEDIQFELEVINDVWKIKESELYTIKSFKQGLSTTLKEMGPFQLTTSYNKKISVIPSFIGTALHPLRKFEILDDIAIGKGEENDIIYDFDWVSKEHADIIKKADGYYLMDYSSNGTYVNNKKVDEIKLEFGDYINIFGLHIVFLDGILAIDIKSNLKIRVDALKLIQDENQLEQVDDFSKSQGKTIFRRSPRNYQEVLKDTIEIEGPPELNKSKQQSLMMAVGPALTMALPMLLGSSMMIYASKESGTNGLYMYSGLVMAVSSAAVGVIWSITNMKSTKKEEKAFEELRRNTYSKYLIEKTEEIKQKYNNAKETMSRIYPSAEIVSSYGPDKGGLWTRNRTHEDFITHRLGLGNVDFNLNISVPKKKFKMVRDELAEKPLEIKEKYGVLYDVPILVDLLKHHIVGIIGDQEKKRALDVLRLLVAQLAANNCYTDVKMVFIYDANSSSNAEEWNFAKWLPHVWSSDKKVRYIASNKQEINEVLYELTNALRTRIELEDSRKNDVPKPYYVVFVSDAKLLEGELFAKYVSSQDPKLGLTTVILAEEYQELPNDCEFVIENTDNFKGCYSVFNQQSTRKTIKFDYLNHNDLEAFARQISRLQVNEMEEGGEIPESLTFFDMYGVDRLEELPVADSWLKNRTYENIRGILGAKAGGSLCYLDVHEKYHGPHGLVAGTTGSGKSETLQTYMLSLAVNYSPDDISFFIIDYKGGGMANLFDGLPHMVGQISNLSGNQVRRAMISIKSENKRRQRIFNENGVNNINLYTKLYKNGEASQPVPHLFIIIDEFAELKREEPDFMRELISVAQVGRSLGVHLILATQKPSGTVDDNIWSNSKFRLCLRVQDTQDSKDMLHKPDAAYITQAGRAYLQVGSDEVFELFQSGYSGASYDANRVVDVKESAQLINLIGKVELGSKTIRKNKAQKKDSVKEVTQLDAVKEYLAKMSVSLGYKKPVPLWMPELPSAIYLDEFEGTRKPGFNLEFILGKVDDPENQRQIPLTVDLSKGHIGIIGNIVSGKSTMMQTMAFALMNKFTPAEINMYGLDFSSRMLSAFEESPHFGGVMYEVDVDKIAKFFNMMNSILKERKEKFRGGNYEQYIQVHGMEYPAIVIFVDNYGAFKEKTEEKYEDQMIQLSKEGLNHGIYLVISGQSFGYTDITNRVGENLKTMLCLSLNDKFSYIDYLHTNQIHVIPGDYKGRGLAVFGESVLEYQTALALKAPDDYSRKNLIQEKCLECGRNWNGKVARAVPVIPEKPVYSQLAELDDFKKISQDPNYIPVGYDRDNASVYGIPLSKTYCYLVTGKQKTGKSNFVRVMIQSCLKKENAQICIMDDPSKTYKQFANNERIHYCEDEASIFEYFKNITPEFIRRDKLKQELVAKDLEEEEIFEEMKQFDPIFIFISNLDWFIPLMYLAKSEQNFSGFIENVFAKGSLHNLYFVGEICKSKRSMCAGYEAYKAFEAYEMGMHFGGNTEDESIWSFDYLSYNERSKNEKVGIGMLPNVEDGTKAVVIPHARK